MSANRRWIALSTLVLALLLISIDATVLGLALPHLAEDLRPSATQVLWIGDVYGFVLAGLLVTMGSLGDRIGRKKLLMIGAVGFGLASIPAAFAPTAEVLIASRALLGVAGATLMPSTLSLIRNIFTDPKERSVAIGVWSAMASAGAAVGPLVGGLLLDHFWWGSVFLINVPVMVLLVAVGMVVLPESRDPHPGPWDLPSVGLSMVGIIGVVYAIKEIAAYGVAHPLPWLAGVVGAIALYLFARRQNRLHSPLVEIRLFTNPRFSGAVAADLMTIVGLTAVVFFLSQFLQLVQGYSALEAGLRELPAVGGAAVAALAAGWLASRTSARLMVTTGLAMVGAGLAAIVMLERTTPYLPIAVIMVVIGLGAGLSTTVTADLIMSSVRKEKAGAASAISESAYELGSALGIAILGTMLTAFYRAQVVAPPGSDVSAVRDSIGGAVVEAAKLPARLAAGLLESAQTAFVGGLRIAAAAGAVLLVAAAVAAWFTLRRQPAEVDEERASVRVP
ncbi:MFS transporter [Fodinicola acaciae]|uniref:MFS transporter n=1 Tax=Fodinicola acaciae TaxID=2681555 RepID=UPI0013D54C47|nr:MFS transporter [Fodinicola acaciae]